MHFSSTLISVAAMAATASAQAGTTIKVKVGNGGLVYTPSDIIAEVGTNIEFDFFPKNHSVTQSSFKDPCHPLENGFFSTFIPTANSPSGSTFTITIQDTKPIWLYCGQGNHCQSGMVASINAPVTGNTFQAFKLLAQNATASTSPPGGAAIGGILQLAGGASSESASASGATTLSSTISTTKTVQATVTATITSTVTQGGSTYATTYPSTYSTSYTTAVAASTVAIVEASGSSTSTSSSAPATSSGNSAAGLAINGGMAGAVVLAAFAML